MFRPPGIVSQAARILGKKSMVFDVALKKWAPVTLKIFYWYA